ncbi:hypothetical protein QF031_000247 [Pseudarthrobacter defluvii]|nr:hypothetical protein [Pseudarthrobacter defluvii]MDQ0767498.1 hypothetical protein [Pseudarthrobacter defluvii]
MTIKGGSTIDQSSAERRNLGAAPKSVCVSRKRPSGAVSALR